MAVCYSCFLEKEEDFGPCPHCGYDPAEAEDKYPVALRHGSILNGRFITGRVLGQGGFGITYVALDDRTGMRVAVKEYFPMDLAGRTMRTLQVFPLSSGQKEYYDYGKGLFVEEARTLAEFNGDPHIAGIYRFFEENGTAYFAMEYVDGLPLDHYAKLHGGKLSPEETNRLLLPLMDSLSRVHARGVIHRDIAPDNILVQRDGTAKLIDFGAARYSTGEKSKSLDVMLKHGFAPFEQYARHGRQGAYTDVYAMAATWYYTVTGKMVPDAMDRKSRDTLQPPSSLGIALSPGMEKALLKALSVNAADRYQSMEQFRNGMEPEGKKKPRNPGRNPEPPIHGGNPPSTGQGSSGTQDHPSGPTRSVPPSAGSRPAEGGGKEPPGKSAPQRPQWRRAVIVLLLLGCFYALLLNVHVWRDASCEKPRTCIVCGMTEGRAKGHRWKYDGGLNKHCEVCGKKSVLGQN